jgi:hypothetical protein
MIQPVSYAFAFLRACVRACALHCPALLLANTRVPALGLPQTRPPALVLAITVTKAQRGYQRHMNWHA